VDTPADLLPCVEHVERVSSDGVRLHALWVAAAGRPSDRTIVQHHGYNGAGGVLMADDREPLMAWPLVRAARQRGYNLLLVDARAHGRSDGPWDGDARHLIGDLAAWGRWLRIERQQLWVGLWGNSLGSMVGLLQAMRPAAGGLDALVLDSTPISAEGLYSGLLGPSAAIFVQPVVRRLTDPARQRAFPGGRLVFKSHGWPPVLLVHGENDRHVPVEQSEQAYRMLREAGGDGRCELWRIPGADHLGGLDRAGDEYTDRVIGWFDRWFSGDSQTTENLAQRSQARAWLVPISEGGAHE
jgi:pimeloyl-ACP methyl ester carboxylesterase